MAVKIKSSLHTPLILHSYKSKSFFLFNTTDFATVLKEALNVRLVKVVWKVADVNSELDIATQLSFDVLKIGIR